MRAIGLSLATGSTVISMSNVKVVLVPLTLRLAGTDEAQVLARASWAVRRLLGQGPAAEVDLRGFLGRAEVTAAQDPEADRPVGVELDALGGHCQIDVGSLMA